MIPSATSSGVGRTSIVMCPSFAGETDLLWRLLELPPPIVSLRSGDPSNDRSGEVAVEEAEMTSEGNDTEGLETCIEVEAGWEGSSSESDSSNHFPFDLIGCLSRPAMWRLCWIACLVGLNKSPNIQISTALNVEGWVAKSVTPSNKGRTVVM